MSVDDGKIATEVMQLCDGQGLDAGERVVVCSTVIVHAIAFHFPSDRREEAARAIASAIISGVDDYTSGHPKTGGRA